MPVSALNRAVMWLCELKPDASATSASGTPSAIRAFDRSIRM